jgi:hypothetical protein
MAPAASTLFVVVTVKQGKEDQVRRSSLHLSLQPTICRIATLFVCATALVAAVV